MSLALIVTPAARQELEEAIAWYEAGCPGLGQNFKLEVKSALDRAMALPQHFQQVHGSARRIRLRRFKKYGIYFAVKGNAFVVLSVFHGARNPSELRRRLQ
jgi:toxin ParE1/3/4